jgi:outer membrane protein TolC
MALKQSPEIKKAQANLSLAGASLQSSVGAVLPHVTGTSSYGQSGPATINQNGSFDSYRTSLGVSQSLVDLSNWTEVVASGYARSAAGATYVSAVASLVYQVKQAFYNQIKLEKALEVAQASVKQSEEQAKRAEVMFQLGSMSRADMLKLQVRLIQSKVDLLSAQNGLLAGRQALASILGRTGEVTIRGDLSLPDTLKWEALSDTITEKELEQNPAYKAAKRNYQSKKAGAWSAWLSKLPYLSGSYSYGYSDSVQFKGSSGWNDHDYWSASIALNWNIFDGGLSLARIRQARAQARSAEADLFTARQSVHSELRQAKLSLRMASEAIGLVRDLQQQAEEDYRLTQEKYRLGSASVLDLLSSQLTYNQAQQQATNTLCDYYLAQARYQKALGAW